jgi:hypothetical protein
MPGIEHSENIWNEQMQLLTRDQQRNGSTTANLAPLLFLLFCQKILECPVILHALLTFKLLSNFSHPFERKQFNRQMPAPTYDQYIPNTNATQTHSCPHKCISVSIQRVAQSSQEPRSALDTHLLLLPNSL